MKTFRLTPEISGRREAAIRWIEMLGAYLQEIGSDNLA
jgi:hypothetical protein